jgi:hypothetical protein
MTANSGDTPAQRIARVFEAAAVARALGDLAGRHCYQCSTKKEWHAEKPVCKAGA